MVGLLHHVEQRVILGGLPGNYTISWTGWAQVVDHILDGSMGRDVRLERLLQQLELMSPVPVRGLFRREAVRQAGPVRSDEFRALSEICLGHEGFAVGQLYPSSEAALLQA